MSFYDQKPPCSVYKDIIFRVSEHKILSKYISLLQEVLVLGLQFVVRCFYN